MPRAPPHKFYTYYNIKQAFLRYSSYFYMYV